MVIYLCYFVKNIIFLKISGSYSIDFISEISLSKGSYCGFLIFYCCSCKIFFTYYGILFGLESRSNVLKSYRFMKVMLKKIRDLFLEYVSFKRGFMIFLIILCLCQLLFTFCENKITKHKFKNQKSSISLK